MKGVSMLELIAQLKLALVLGTNVADPFAYYSKLEANLNRRRILSRIVLTLLYLVELTPQEEIYQSLS
jgi:hypothetical protein